MSVGFVIGEMVLALGEVLVVVDAAGTVDDAVAVTGVPSEVEVAALFGLFSGAEIKGDESKVAFWALVSSGKLEPDG